MGVKVPRMLTDALDDLVQYLATTNEPEGHVVCRDTDTGEVLAVLSLNLAPEQKEVRQ